MMATTHLPSIVQAAFGSSFDHSLKNDKLFNTDDHEYEISKWLKLENDPLLSGPNTFADLGSDALLSNSVTYTTANSQAAIQDFPASYFTSTAYTFSAPTSIVNNSSSPQLPPPLPTPQFVGSNNRQLPQPLPQTYTYTLTPVPQTTQQFSTQYTPSFQTLQYAQPFTTQYTSQFAPAYSSTQAQYTYTTTTPQYEASNPQYIQIATNPQYATQTNSVVPSQLFQQQYNGSSPASESQNSLPPQFQYVYQYPVVNKNSIVTSQGDELSEEKKRKQNPRPVARRVRQTRPKVVEAKGAVQCKGRNRKKGTQCRNAALMEYIGPRPVYCAEHIELDPKSLYEKCKSSYQKDPGDNKGCKEVVLKEFGVCYKHYADLITEMIENREYERIRKHSDRITELLAQLERDAAAAKKKDGDLYQRKNKLIPKFQEMKKQAVKALEAVDNVRQKDFEDDLPSDLAQLSAPIVLDGISVHIVESLSSESDDDLSSPQSDSSLDEFDQILN